VVQTRRRWFGQHYVDYAAVQPSSEAVQTLVPDPLALAVLSACRSALIKSPAASRAALEKYRDSIDLVLAKTLHDVGGYEIEDGNTALHESVRHGDVAIAQYLIAAGANVNATDRSGAKPVDIATGDACRGLLEHHAVSILKCE